MPTALAQKVGPYEITRVIGRGGMAMVYEARRLDTDKSVALKIPHEEFASNPKLMRKFFDEANFSARVHHPNVVEVFEVGTADSTPYMALELLQGLTVDRLIRREKQVDVGQALEIARQTADALVHVHRMHVHHKDIKPKNLMVLADGRVKIMDFGVAHLGYWSNEEAEGTHGTPAYLAPEQLDGLPTDERTDLYALGITLFEMIAGAKPFRGGSAIDLRRKITDEPIPSIRALNSQASASVETIIEKATAKRPENRYKNAREMSDALGRALREWERATGATVTLKGMVPALTTSPAPTPFEPQGEAEHPVAVITRVLRWPFKILAGLLACMILIIMVVYVGLWTRGHLISQFAAHEGGVNAVAMTGDQSRIITAGGDGVARVWSMDTLPDPDDKTTKAKPEIELKTGDKNLLAAAALSRDRLLVSGSGQSLSLWDMRTGKQVGGRELSNAVIQSMATLAGGRRALAGRSDRAARVYEIEPVQSISAFEGHKGVVYGVSATGDGKLAFTGDGMGTLALWETSSGKPARVWKGHEDKIAATAISPDGRVGVSGGADKEIKVWEMKTGKLLRTLKGHALEITDLALLDGGGRALSVDADGLMILWDLEKGARAWDVKIAGGPINALAVTADGTRAVTGGADGRARVWRVPLAGDGLHLSELKTVLVGFSQRVFAGS